MTRRDVSDAVFVGACFVVFSIAFYIGFWYMFIGGIVQSVTAFEAPEISVLELGFGVLKICLAGPVGSLICLVGFTIMKATFDIRR